MMKQIAILVLVALASYVRGSEDSFEDKYCKSNIAFRGVPQTTNFTLPANSLREDVFNVIQVFKGQWSYMNTQATVVYKHTENNGCADDYPYDRQGREVVIFGFKVDDSTINIMDCDDVFLYADVQQINDFSTNSPCEEEFGFGFK